jgi:hypothetical protein
MNLYPTPGCLQLKGQNRLPLVKKTGLEEGISQLFRVYVLFIEGRFHDLINKNNLL